MWGTLAAVAPLLALLSRSVAGSSSPGYLQMDMERRVARPAGEFWRRDDSNGSFDALLPQNPNKLEYLVNITVGTPPQKMAVTLDTGSSDLWVPAVNSQPCLNGTCDEGSFDPTASSTYHVVAPNAFNITYAAPGDSDAGDWASETITVGGSPKIQGQIFGLSLNGYDLHGVMGLGYDTNEASDPLATNGVYQSTMDSMVAQGLINRKAFSLYLNEYSANTGAVIFGGIDTTKYAGDLVGLPLQIGPEGMLSEFYVTLTSVSVTDDKGRVTTLTPAGYAQAALLDSGTSATLLTNDVFALLATGFGAVDVSDEVGPGISAVPCSYRKSNATINYQFGGAGGPIINVPLAQIIGNQYFDGSGFDDSSGGCDFGIGPPADGIVILGDTFLRSAYVVFDLQNNAAAIAQAKWDVSSSSIVAIPAGTALPMVTSTATMSGTQLQGAAATSEYVPRAAKTAGTTVLAGTPTFALGVSRSSAAGAAAMMAPMQAVLVGAGLIFGAMMW